MSKFRISAPVRRFRPASSRQPAQESSNAAHTPFWRALNRRVDEPREADTESFAEKAAVYATRPIRTEDEYDHAQQIIRQLLREPHPEGSLAYDVLEVLAILVQDYEEKDVPELPEATPQEIVQFMAEQRGMIRGDLAEILGGRSRLSEFFSGKRALSIGQVKSLREELGIPADLLIG